MMRVLKGLVPLLLGLILVAPVFGSGYKSYYYVKNNCLYYRTYYPRTYYYNSAPYVTYYYKDVYKTDSTKPDWKTEMVRVANQIQENKEFNEALSKILPHQQQPAAYGSYPVQQQAAYYPSQTGNTVGGFSSYHYARYGDVKSMDANRAIELQQQGVDNVTRMSAELGTLSNGVAVQAVALQNLNGERIGAIAEAQELRASLREMQMGLKDQMLAQAEFMRSMRPSSSETFSGQRQQGSTYNGQQPPNMPSNGGPFQSPQQPTPSAPTPVFAQFCGRCHGPAATSPGGGWTFNGGAIDSDYWGGLYLRIDPNTPARSQDGSRLLRMPPEGADQPSVEQRRQLVSELRQFVQLR